MWYFQTYNELYHHGILGQRWGVRRFQNKDGSLTNAGKTRYSKVDPSKSEIVGKKGEKWSHISSKPVDIRKGSGKPLYIFNGNDEHDASVYRASFARYKQLHEGAQYVRENRYKLKEDLISPDRIERGKIFVETYRKNPEQVTAALNKMNAAITYAKSTGMQLSPYMKELVKPMKFDEKTKDSVIADLGYKTFAAIIPRTPNEIIAQARYLADVKAKGYNAIVDDNNKGVYNDARMPVIVIDQKQSLKNAGGKWLSEKEIAESYNKIYDYMQKTGRRVAL